MTTYTYYQGTDRIWKVTDALGHVWEYTYTSGYGDVKSVRDPEGGVAQYVYDYELNEPVYGLVRQVIDALGRATEYQYYAVDEANLARRGQVRRVIVPGGFWREMDYSGLGWLVSRTVQTANGSETTTYTYDAWGRLRGIDYPRSADVRMGWDGEGRRVWVEDGVGRRDYTYDAWGRVVLQEGCCGSSEGIEVVAVSAAYDAAGRKMTEEELRSDKSAVRTIKYTYDYLGRLKSVGDDRGAVGYSYERGTGRLEQEVYPNGSYVAYTYYGASHPSQVGQVWKVEHKRANSGTLLIGYEYTYDLLGRVVQSVERPSGDMTVYSYTPAGRLESEARTGQVAYRRAYQYNLDGSRRYVERDDAVNGFHQDEYVYDAVSGRLASVIDRAPEPDVVYSFSWNPEGTLARWEDPTAGYARVFGYDEEGRVTRIERDYGNGNLQVYGYNSDGVRVWKRDVLNQQEYRYVCRIGCGGVPMRVYQREIGGGTWASVEEYRTASNVIIYTNPYGHFVDYGFPVGGSLLLDLATGDGKMIVRDAFGRTPQAYTLNFPPPLYLQEQSSFSWSIAWWVVIIVGLVIVGGIHSEITACIEIAKMYEEELRDWPHNHSGNPKGGDKLVHCVAACLIGLHPAGGTECAVLAALSTERGGRPWGPRPAPGSDSDLDEKANFDGVNCAVVIREKRRYFDPTVSNNDWLECQWCCHQQGYRRWH